MEKVGSLRKIGCIPYAITEEEYNACKLCIEGLRRDNVETAIMLLVETVGPTEAKKIVNEIFEDNA